MIVKLSKVSRNDWEAKPGFITKEVWREQDGQGFSDECPVLDGRLADLADDPEDAPTTVEAALRQGRFQPLCWFQEWSFEFQGLVVILTLEALAISFVLENCGSKAVRVRIKAVLVLIWKVVFSLEVQSTEMKASK